jgi:hypothetical protein
MLKKISELTEQEKERFLERTKRAMKKEYGVGWAFVEKKMQEEIAVNQNCINAVKDV